MTPTLYYDSEGLHLLDQRALPAQVRYEVCRTPEETARAIRALVVRGAPAIGVAAAYGMVLGLARAIEAGREPMAALASAREVLAASRPTAVNLFWALGRMQGEYASIAMRPLSETLQKYEAAAHRILSDDVAACRSMGDFGATLLPERARVLTHCNAGALATGGYGTALGVIRSAHRLGRIERVFADETRPVLQGARLTAWELVNEGIPTTLITDSMAGSLMARGEINCVVVGADRIAANGDVINKIGTYSVAVLAAAHGIPFFVAAPRSTFDLNTATAADVVIEERDPGEVLEFTGTRTAPQGVDVFNPAFDATPAARVAAIICETGVAREPYSRSLRELMSLPFETR